MAHKTKYGAWKVRWRDRATGVMKAKHFDRKCDAERFEAEIKLGRTIDREPEQIITFREFVETWYRDHCLVYKAPTQHLEDRRLLDKRLIPLWGDRPMGSLRRKDLVELQSSLTHAGEIKPRTINIIAGLAKKIMADALAWQVIPVNSFAGVRPLPTPEQHCGFWTSVERDRFLTFCKERDPALFDVVLFAVNTGLRLGEIEGLYMDCIDFMTMQICVRRNWNYKTKRLFEHTKGKTIRWVPINQAVLQLVQGHRLKAPNQKLFEFPIRDMGEGKLKPMCKKAGVSIMRFHDLRHTFGSLMAMAGVDVWFIQKIMGHADVKTTQRYMHLAPNHLRGMTEALNGVPRPVPREVGKVS